MADTTNKLGHKIGARGGRTRQAILDATQRLLNERHYGEIRVADLASAAGVSPSNFYTYFKAVEEPVLALCEVAAADFQGLAAHFQADWPGDKAFVIARAFILDVMAIWRSHGQVLRVEHMLADNGDAAFVESRVRRLRRLHLSIERRVAQAHASGLHQRTIIRGWPPIRSPPSPNRRRPVSICCGGPIRQRPFWIRRPSSLSN